LLAVFATDSAAVPVLWSGNGHYYEAVDHPTTTFTYEEAFNNAQSSTYAGLQGHLATITSAAENAFIAATFPQAAQAFGYLLGAIQPAGSPEPGGGWQWVTGEAFSFTNWIGGEPNNAGGNENAIHLRNSSGQWNDIYGPGSTYGFGTSVHGYLIEYSFPVQQTPEPSVLFLMALGLLALARRYWATSARRVRAMRAG
jgi:hypothetical protein